MNREELHETLKDSIVTVTFTKKNGELRKMTCTLLEDYLPPLEGSSAKRNPSVMPVWDLEKDAWRSFRIDSIIEVEVL